MRRFRGRKVKAGKSSLLSVSNLSPCGLEAYLWTERKRPTTADEFGSALTSLLSESTKPKDKKAITASTPLSALPTAPEPKAKKAQTTVQPILSLSRAKLPPTATTEKLERQAARAVKREKEEKEDRARVRDVVEGWSHAGPGEGEVIGGLEFEKGLRKTAQRGGELTSRFGWETTDNQSSSCSTPF